MSGLSVKAEGRPEDSYHCSDHDDRQYQLMTTSY